MRIDVQSYPIASTSAIFPSPRFWPNTLALTLPVACSDKEQLAEAFYEFKVIADQKKVVTDAVCTYILCTPAASLDHTSCCGVLDAQDLEALMDYSSQQDSENNWALQSVYVTSGVSYSCCQPLDHRALSIYTISELRTTAYTI